MPSIEHISDAQNPLLSRLTGLMLPRRPTVAVRQVEPFVAEGRILIETLAKNAVPFESILISEALAPLISSDFAHLHVDQWIVVPSSVMHEIAGFPFHGGMLGFGVRPRRRALGEVVAPPAESQGIVVCSSLRNRDNIALIIRSAWAFGYGAVVISDSSADPHSRRCLRVSMGTSLLLPVVESTDLHADLAWLRDQGFAIVAATTSARTLPFRDISPSRRNVIVLGNESEGLGSDILSLCDLEAKIPMIPAQDSLNVAVAAGILMQHFSPLN